MNNFHRLLFFLLVFLSCRTDIFAQDFSFREFSRYRNGFYLDVPLPFLRTAPVHLQLGDTLACFNDINRAIDNGLYEPVRLQNNKQFSALHARKEWKVLLDRIDRKRKSIADPANLEISVKDLSGFFRFLPDINKPDADRLLMENYILPGSPGLKAFFDLKLNARPETMVAKIRSDLKYYQSIRQLEPSIRSLIPDIRKAAVKLEEYYPEAIFPPIYFMVGVFNIGGTPDIANGLLIGSEFFASHALADTSQLTANEKFALYDTSRLVPVVIHEFIHIEQKNPWGSNLLEQSIIEGACDFIATLLLQKPINARLHKYGYEHERELWDKFEKEKDKTDYSDWLYNGSKMSGTGIPANLGYYMGYMICESYFKQKKDIRQTITDILEIKDFKEFLAKSGYENKFK